MQDAYLRALRGFAGFRGGDAKPWLLAIVRNAAYRVLGARRQAGNVVSLDQARNGGEGWGTLDVPDPAPSAEAMLIGAADRDMVQQALAALAPIYREVLVLREIEGLDYRAIAEVTGTAMGTVMSRLARGREQLRNRLATQQGRDRADAL